MADPNNLDPSVQAYVARDDGDLIRADDWNDIQRCARQDIRRHRHTQDPANPDDGVPIGADGLENEAVTAEKLAAGAVTAAKIANNVVTANELANNAVTLTKLANNAVSAEKLQENAVTRAKIANEAVDESKLADAAVSKDKILNGSDSIICNFPVAGDIVIREDLDRFTHEQGINQPAMAADSSGNIHAVWTAGNPRTVFYAKLDGAGDVVVEPASKLTTGTQSNDRPTLAVDLDDNLHVVWEGRDSSNNRQAFWYAKLTSAGDIAINSRLIVSASNAANNGNHNPNISADPAGNLQLVWSARNSGENLRIWYAKRDKNGAFLVDPSIKLTPSQNAHFQFPCGTVTSDGLFHVFFFANEIQRAVLDSNGNVQVTPTLSLTLNKLGAQLPLAVHGSTTGSILIAVQLAASGIARPGFVKLDEVSDELAHPIVQRYVRRLRSFEAFASAPAPDGALHVLLGSMTGSELHYAKLDVNKEIQGATLTELFTTYRWFNF